MTIPRAVAPTALRRCPSDEHVHDRSLGALNEQHRAVGLPATPSRRARAEVAEVLQELERRRCAGGPLVVRDDGVADRLEPDSWIGAVLAALPEDDERDGTPEPSLTSVLHDMGIATVEDLRSFRRLVAVHAALAAVRWSAAPPPQAPAALAALLQEVDDPSQAWT